MRFVSRKFAVLLWTCVSGLSCRVGRAGGGDVERELEVMRTGLGFGT